MMPTPGKKLLSAAIILTTGWVNGANANHLGVIGTTPSAMVESWPNLSTKFKTKYPILSSYHFSPLIRAKIPKEPAATIMALTDQPFRSGDKEGFPALSDHPTLEIGERPPFAASEDPVSPELAITIGHRYGISSLDWSPDGELLLTGSVDNTTKIWHVKSGSVLRTLVVPQVHVRGLRNRVIAAAFASDGQQLLVGSSDGSRAWDTHTGRLVRTLDPPENLVRAVAISRVTGLRATAGSGEEDLGAKPFVRLFEQSSMPYLELDLKGVYEINALNFSEDGTLLVTGGSAVSREVSGGVNIKGIVLVWDTHSGERIATLDIGTESVEWVAFSPDSTEIYTYAKGRVVRVSRATGRELSSFPAWNVSLSQDGRYLAVDIGQASSDKEPVAARIIDPRTNLVISSVPWPFPDSETTNNRVSTLAFSPDGSFLSLGFRNGKIAIWDIAAAAYLAIWHPREFEPDKFQLADRDGRRLAIARGRNVMVWDLHNGNMVVLSSDDPLPIDVVALSPDGTVVAAGTQMGKVTAWNLETGEKFLSVHVTLGGVKAISFSNDGTRMATAGIGEVRLWRTCDGQFIKTIASSVPIVEALSFLPDDSGIAVGDQIGNVQIFSVEGTNPPKVLSSPGVNATVQDLAFDRSGQKLVVGYGNGFNRAIIYDLSTGAKLPLGLSQASVDSVNIDAEGRLVTTGGRDQIARVWAADTGDELFHFNHPGIVRVVAFSKTNSHLLTYADQTIHIWDLKAGTEKSEPLLQLFALEGNGWAVVAADGRFDTNDLESVKGLNWLMPDEPLRPLPLEIFMRQYFEPRLLPRLLAGEEMSKVRSLRELNRVQPIVKVVSVDREKHGSEELETVRVVVNVEGGSGEFGHGGSKRVMTTDVYDLRLFRDGQLIEQRPKEDEGIAEYSNIEQELDQWRRNRILKKYINKADKIENVIFEGIRIPRRAGVNEVQFSAYAFNKDQIKSVTDKLSFPIPSNLQPRMPHAYIITIGINAFQDNAWDLSYAANDARQFGSTLKKTLKDLREPGGNLRYEKVVWVPLISDARQDKGGSRQILQATKAQIEAVLKTLAGQPIDTLILQGLKDSKDLRRVNPEDTVIIMISTHGMVDDRGTFYFLPADIGSKFLSSDLHDPVLRAKILKHVISNNELAQWLRGMDAINQVMIIDACHSAASVQNGSFKPGPLGSRGLGQLSYDKGISILAASQVDQDALETGKTEMGLLIYALIKEGLKANKADNRPPYGRIMLSEWLNYANQRVPGIFKDLQDGKLRGRRGTVIYAEDPYLDSAKRSSLQQPSLFDFYRGRDIPVAEQRSAQ